MDSWFGLDTLSLRNKPDTMLKVSRQLREMQGKRLGARLAQKMRTWGQSSERV